MTSNDEDRNPDAYPGRDPYGYRHPNSYRNLGQSSAPTASVPRARSAQAPEQVRVAQVAPKSASRVSTGLVVALAAVGALSVGAGLAVGALTHTASTSDRGSAAACSAPAQAPQSAAAASAAVALPADLCALNSADTVAATVGFATPSLVSPIMGQLGDLQRDHPEARQCLYNAAGGSVHIVLRKGVTREQFDASQAQVSAESGQTHEDTQATSTYIGPLSGVADAAFDVTTASHAFGGKGIGATVFALDGDIQIEVIASSVDRADPAKVADLVRLLVSELH
jgi:hypothetical protein